MAARLRCSRLVAAFLMGLACALMSCRDQKRPDSARVTPASGPLSHSAYIWQRDWQESVRSAVKEHGSAFDELSVLGAQFAWRTAGSAPEIVRPGVHWESLASTGRPVSVSLRIERAGPVPEMIDAITAEAARLIKAATVGGVNLCGFQIDFDCPQSKLPAYTSWLRPLRSKLRPSSVRITVLASWLKESEFSNLIDSCDGYILQVHSFDRPAPGQRPAVCDPLKTRAWVQQAAALGRPFTVALPTYRTTAGYDANGKLLGVATDSVSPRWMADTTLEEFPSDPDELAGLIAEWMHERPASLTGVWWYRFPVSSDTRNWRWPALASVMAGRPPLSKLEVAFNGSQPVDLVLWNRGEKDEWLPETIMIHWPEPARVFGDALAGWRLAVSADAATFSLSSSRSRLLPTGQSVALGWLRFHESPPPPAALRADISLRASPSASDPKRYSPR